MLQSCESKTIEADNYSPEVITFWNGKIMELAIAEDGLLTLKGVRTEAMVVERLCRKLSQSSGEGIGDEGKTEPLGISASFCLAKHDCL